MLRVEIENAENLIQSDRYSHTDILSYEWWMKMRSIYIWISSIHVERYDSVLFKKTVEWNVCSCGVYGNLGFNKDVYAIVVQLRYRDFVLS